MRILALGGVIGPAVFFLAVAISATLRPNYSHITNFISELGATGSSRAILMNFGGFIPSGLLLAGFGVSLRKLLPRSRPTLVASVLTTAFGLGMAASGIISCDPGCPQGGGSTENFVHDKLAPVSFLCLILSSGILGLHFRRLPTWRSLSLYSLLTCVVALALLGALVNSLETRVLTGLWQRLMLATLFLWTSVIGFKGWAIRDRLPSAGQ